ncbi:MAG: DUF4199 domain-containing protein [Flavisolibacter sp.]
MQTPKAVTSQIAGLIIAGILIVVSVIVSMIDRSSRPGSGWISYLTIIVGLVLFINFYAKSKDYSLGFGDLFSYGFKAVSVTTLVFLVFIVILAIAMPGMKQEAVEAARAEMEKNRTFSQSDVDKGIQLVEKYFWVFMAGATMLSFIIAGAIGSLIGAAITKKPARFLPDHSNQSNL